VNEVSQNTIGTVDLHCGSSAGDVYANRLHVQASARQSPWILPRSLTEGKTEGIFSVGQAATGHVPSLIKPASSHVSTQLVEP